jgi:mRNA interferase HicA
VHTTFASPRKNRAPRLDASLCVPHSAENIHDDHPREIDAHPRECTFETHRGGSGHITVRRGERRSQLPMHDSRKELGTKLVNKILKDLRLK